MKNVITLTNIKQLLSKLIGPYSRSFNKNSLNRLAVYEAIRNKQLGINNNRSHSELEKLKLPKNESYKCDGCSVSLQSKDTNKYGYINQKKLEQALSFNQSFIKDIYQAKVQKQQGPILNMLHEVEKELGVQIFNKKENTLQNLDNLNVLMKLQQKIDRYQDSEQLLTRSKKTRKEILCFRCFSLKYHNRLPEQYDTEEKFNNPTSEVIIDKILNRHKGQDVQYLYVIDVLDIAGTFQYELYEKIIKKAGKLVIVVNKLDIVNQRYLNKQLIHNVVNEIVDKYNRKVGLEDNKKVEVFFACSLSKSGVKKLKNYLDEKKPKRIQLLGYPNTGKTTLLNTLAKLTKPTSKIPGTTTHITQNVYKTSQTIYDMPGLYLQHLLYNLIKKNTQKSLLTWHKFYSPALLTHSAFFFGGKVECYGVRIVLFGLGGACTSSNSWFLLNYNQFWKGLPDLNTLKITKYQKQLVFTNGKTQDLQIQGYGFIGFKISERIKNCTKKLTFYLPQIVRFNFRPSILSDDPVIHNPSAQTKQFMLKRLKPSPIKDHSKVRSIPKFQQNLKQ